MEKDICGIRQSNLKIAKENTVFEIKMKERLSQGEAAWGASLPDCSEIIAQCLIDTGIDFLWIDSEHRPWGPWEIRMIPTLCRRKGCAPMIRVAGLDPIEIKKALDIGASAIMIPQVNNAQEAALAVQYAKYPPEGTRGVSPFWPSFLGVQWDEYFPIANRETCIVVQIESLEAIDNVEAIASVEGVDVLFAGPMDLSAALGHIGQIDHPIVTRFLEEFPQRVQASGKTCGITHCPSHTAQEWYQLGYRFMAIEDMVTRGTAALRTDLQKLRQLGT